MLSAGLCSTSEYENDEFVGLRFQNGKPRIIFPRGYHIQKDEQRLRTDIVKLLGAISFFNKSTVTNELNKIQRNDYSNDYPFSSYQYIIRDFLAHGYYVEKEVHYKSLKKGKINWKRTIQMEQPQIENENVVYLDFRVKTNKINHNNLITKIHEYCVYDSVMNIGWLFFPEGYTVPKPEMPFNKPLFLDVLYEASINTFNVSKKRLFQCMANIIEQSEESCLYNEESHFGTYRFEYIWERMVDYIFGIDNKQEYFPSARWYIVRPENRGYIAQSSTLEPDTIMLYDNKAYILDAKYYQYGITYNPSHLPQTASIQKQITYGEYMDEQGTVRRSDIYNAFIMPFDKEKNGDNNYKFVSVGTADWKYYVEDTPNYNYVLGILVDVRFLINEYTRLNKNEICKLAELIESSIAQFRE